MASMAQPLSTQTTSVDSIGSCSLDVNATGTTSPATLEAVDGSRRSLRSVSLENNLSSVAATGANKVTTPVRPILKPQPFTDPGILHGPGDTGDSNYKTPSYLGISCAVNGYSRLNRYDSTLRDGFRSRDASPARLAFSRSRDSSPMRPEWKLFDSRTKISPQATAAKIKELKEELARFKAEFPHPPTERGRPSSSKRLGRRPSQTRSVSVDRGYLTKADSETMSNQGNTSTDGPHVRLVEISMDDSNSIKSSSYQYSFEKSVVRGGVCESSDSIHCSHTNGDAHSTKSFIQSRIERLYGPSALAAGFRSRRSLLELEKEQKDRQSGGGLKNMVLTSHSENNFEPEDKAPDGFPSVFRHLRPEFRTQLPVKRNSRLRLDTSLEIPSINTSLKIESLSNRPGRVIPITIEGEEPIPPVPLPQTDTLTRKDASHTSNKDTQKVEPKILENGDTEKTKPQLSNGPCVNGSAVKETDSVKEDDLVKRTNKVNGVAEPCEVIKTSSSPAKLEKDGHYFLKVVEEVVSSIEAEVLNTEQELELHGSEMTEEIRGKVLAAIGKARLLVSQKIQQFRGLCHKNIAGSEGEEFPTTSEDLAGFWDMVSIQVDDIKNSLQEIAKLKANGWKELSWADTVDGSGKNVMTGQAQKKPAPRPARAAKSTKSGAKTEEGKARDEARKKMMEERRRAMKEAMKAKKAEAEAKKASDGDTVEIFIPEDK